MALSSFNALGTWDRLHLRTTGGPSESGGAVTGWPEANGGTGAILAGAAPVFVADPLGDGSGPSAQLVGSDGGFETGVEAGSSDDFTAFLICRLTDVSGTRTWIGTTNTPGLYLYHDGAALRLYDDSTSTDAGQGLGIAINTNYRVILTRTSGTLRCYLNGTLGSTPISSTSHPDFEFGTDTGGNYPIQAHILSFGVMVGTALAGDDLTALNAAMTEEIDNVGDSDGFELVTDPGAFTLSGQDAGLVYRRILVAETGSARFTLTGIAAGLVYVRKLAADAGAFTLDGIGAGLNVAFHPGVGAFALSGVDAELTKVSYLAADPGTFSLAGQDTALVYSRDLVADPGDFSLAGQTIDLVYIRSLAADQGSFSLAGLDAGLTYRRILTNETGTFVLDGQDADLVGDQNPTPLDAEPGSFSLEGQDLSFAYSSGILAEPGEFALDGQDAGLSFRSTLVADPGSFSLEGQTTALTYRRSVTADAASFSLQGQDAALTYRRSLEAVAGSFNLSGENVTLLADLLLSASTAAFSLSGAEVGLAYGETDVPQPSVRGAFALVVATQPSPLSVSAASGRVPPLRASTAVVLTQPPVPSASSELK